MLVPGLHLGGQPVDLVARLVVAGVARERAHVRVQRQRLVAPALLVQLADLAQHPHALGVVLEQLDLGLEHRDQLLPLVELAVDRLEHARDTQSVLGLLHQPLERRERGGLLGVGAHDLFVDVDRRGHVGQPRLEQFAQP